MMCGSSALPQPVMQRWEALTGHRLLERYGMTEFGMGLTNPLHGERRPGYVGQPFPGIEIRIGEGESGEPGVGELLLSVHLCAENTGASQRSQQNLSQRMAILKQETQSP